MVAVHVGDFSGEGIWLN